MTYLAAVPFALVAAVIIGRVAWSLWQFAEARRDYELRVAAREHRQGEDAAWAARGPHVELARTLVIDQRRHVIDVTGLSAHAVDF